MQHAVDIVLFFILLGFIGAIELVFGSPLAVCVVCLFLLFSFVKLYVVS